MKKATHNVVAEAVDAAKKAYRDVSVAAKLHPSLTKGSAKKQPSGGD